MTKLSLQVVLSSHATLSPLRSCSAVGYPQNVRRPEDNPNEKD
jgi:hypothetical protein